MDPHIYSGDGDIVQKKTQKKFTQV
jgi:hypothetical protein